MKFTVGFAAGIAAAWAALAVWQRVPPFPDLDASEVPDVGPAAGGWRAPSDSIWEGWTP